MEVHCLNKGPAWNPPLPFSPGSSRQATGAAAAALSWLALRPHAPSTQALRGWVKAGNDMGRVGEGWRRPRLPPRDPLHIWKQACSLLPKAPHGRSQGLRHLRQPPSQREAVTGLVDTVGHEEWQMSEISSLETSARKEVH